ncbi:MAG: hypothetical protein HY913_22505 [Desulfomonile tiedjei]|nr:hypothetical protein [Desulfomonile tiedjei]
MKRTLRIVVSGLVFVAFFTLGVSYVHAASLRGQIVDSQNRPMRGLMISLVSPIPHIGTLGPVVTTSEGFFLFPVVERRGDQPYELQVYWGAKRLHTQRVLINTDIDVGTIRVR